MKGLLDIWKEMNRSERMQLKAFICLLGILLLLLLIVVGLLCARGGGEEVEPQPSESEEEEEHIPVVEQLHNVWIMEADREGLLCYVDGEERLLQIAVSVSREARGETKLYQTDVTSEPESVKEESGNQAGDSLGQQSHIQEEDGTGQQSRILAGEATGWQSDIQDTNWGTDAWFLALREQVADLVLTDGLVTGVSVKSQKVSGKVLAADQDGVWLEGQGRLEFTSDVQGYRLYREMTGATYRDLRIGFDFADFCLEEGKICAILLTREEAMETIRVLLKNSDYQGIYHDRVELTCDTDYTVQVLPAADSQGTVTSYPAGESLELSFPNTDLGNIAGIWPGQTSDSREEESMELTAQRGTRLLVTPTAQTGRIILQSVHRSQGIPAYRGSLELLWTEGGIVLINELPLEEYLYSVVPSEMPASYPQEALKAQAICARTYAYTHMQRAGYEALGAHVDDSSSYQVYNNILEQEAATAAVKATYGQLLMREDGVTPAETYYYSTSWGYGSDAHVWKTNSADSYGYIVPRHLNRVETSRVLAGDKAVEASAEAVGVEDLTQEDVFAAAIRSTDPGDFEAGEGWYRWTYTVKKLNPDRVLQQLQSRYEANDKLVLTQDGEDYISSPIGSFREIRNLTILTRGAGGVADELLIETDRGTYKVISEHNIRCVLCDGETKVRRQDGSQVAMSTLLPSAFFTIEIAREGEAVVGYNLTGGGFGHGVGMSQNGARSMAAEGYSAGDILRFFYEDCSVKEIYDDTEAD